MAQLGPPTRPEANPRREQEAVRTYPLRLDVDDAAALRAAAQIEGVPLAEELRRAVRGHLEQLRADPAFQERLRASIDRDRELYERLGALQDY